MLAYAASRSAAGRQSSPNAMLFIIAAHVAALAVVMSAKMDLPHRIFDRPLKVDTIRLPQEQPKQRPERKTVADPDNRTLTQPDRSVPIPAPFPAPDATLPPADLGPSATGPGPAVAEPQPLPRPPVITRGPQLLTSGAELRPPYPLVKETIGEEATLTLRLLINEKGRVLTVDPIGRADPTFAEVARRHIIIHWRFRPAVNSGQPTMSSTVITVAFRLDK